MVRLKILASAVPLMVAAIFALGELLTGARPCIAIGDSSVQITSLPWQAQLHVSFTDDQGGCVARREALRSHEDPVVGGAVRR